MTDEAQKTDGEIQMEVSNSSERIQGLTRELRDALKVGDTEAIRGLADQIDRVAGGLHRISEMSSRLAHPEE